MAKLVKSNLDFEDVSKIVNLLDPSAAQDAATKNYVDTEVGGAAPLRYAADFGAASGTTYPITHGLNTKDLQVTIRQNAGDQEVIADVVFTDANTVTVNLSAAPGVNALRIVIVG